MRSSGSVGGPIPKFTDYHVWKMSQSLDESNPIGRKALAQRLNIGEGSTRTILSLLQDSGLITVGKGGVLLTPQGTKFKERYHMEVAHLSINDLTIGEKDCAICVRGGASDVRYGCEERDVAIKAGATGATTLIVADGKLNFPGSEYPVSQNITEKIFSSLNPKDGDIIIIGTAPTNINAEVGAVMAGLTLLGGLKLNRDVQDIVAPRNLSNELISLAFAVHDLVGGLPVCAKSRDNLGIRIEKGTVIDNAYTGEVLEEVINVGTTIRRIATSGPYKGIRVIVTPIELDNRVIACIGVVDIRSMAGIDNLIRLRSDDND